MSLTDQQRDEINEAIFAGQKIQAIKLYREATGADLKDSKDFIETLTESLREEYPDKVPDASAGCAAGMLLLTVTSAAIIYTWLV